MERNLRQVAFLLHVPLSAALYVLALGQYRGETPFLAILREPPTLAFVVIAVLWLGVEALLFLPLVGQPPIFGEFSGLAYDPRRKLIAGLVLLPDVVSALDRGQLRRWVIGDPGLRWVGVALLAAALALTLDADRRLARHFRAPGALAASSPITDGPYRFIRHPRSAGLFLGKFATPLALGSVLGLLALVPAVILLPRFIAREEEHLLRIFGDGYRFYRARTRRLIPWLY